MELAEEMAGEMRMPLREYLVGILKYAILTHGKRIDKTDKYVTEFTSQNRKKVATWKPEVEAPEEAPEEDSENTDDTEE